MQRHIGCIGRLRLRMLAINDNLDRGSILIHRGRGRYGEVRVTEGSLLGAESWQTRRSSMACSHSRDSASSRSPSTGRSSCWPSLSIISIWAACFARFHRPIAGDIAVVRASKKKDRIALEAHILTIADFCPNSEDSYAVALFSAQNVCHWVFDFLHRLRQFAARVNRKRKCDLTLQCLRNSQ